MKRIYLDHAATTPVDSDVLDAMLPYFTENYGNASSLHSEGTAAKNALEKSREQVADVLGAASNEIIFTGSGTESDNLAIKGIALRHGSGHVITSQIEHPAVLRTCEYLEGKGFDVTYLPVDHYGRVDPDDVNAAIRDDTILVSVMHANNEIGTIEPVREIARVAHEHGVPVHTDAVQTVGKISVDVDDLDVDLLSLSGHKIYGPKGVGALYVRRKPRIRIEAQMHGGGHERGMRSGTLATHQIVGMGEAFRIAKEEMAVENERILSLRNRLLKGFEGMEEVYVNGDLEHRVAGNLNISFNYVEGESLIMAVKDIAVSSGSACTSASLEPSYVLRALGLSDELAHSSLRFSIGRYTTADEIDYTIGHVRSAVEKLRALSPLWDMYKEGIDLNSVEWAAH